MSKYKFGQRSIKNLSEAHHDFTILFTEVLIERDCAIIEGARGEEEQNKLFHAKKSKLQYPESKHNLKPDQEYVDAVDVVPWPVDWDDFKTFYHFVGYVKGVADKLFREGKIKAQIRCGADWDGDFSFKDQTFNDLPHFERIID